jgi:hypothetical protein
MVLDPDDLALLGRVFDDTLQQLGLVNRNHPMALLAAKRIIELAIEGVSDPVQLCEGAIAAVTIGTLAAASTQFRQLDEASFVRTEKEAMA